MFVAACYLDNPVPRVDTPDAATPSLEAGGDALVDGAAVVEAGSEAGEVDAGTPLCTKYGGYATVEAVIDQFLGIVLADCRISTFFTRLKADRVAHTRDCLIKQVAVVLRCPGIKYDVDNEGVECRDMKTSHLGLSIRSADFDALVQDLVTTLQTAGVAQADIDSIAPSVLALRSDIVTNSAPSHGHAICDAAPE